MRPILATRLGALTPVSVQLPSFQNSAPSGGGYVRTIDIHTDGTMLCSGDVFPLFLGNTSPSTPAWKQIFTASTAPAGILGWSNGITGTNSVWNQGRDAGDPAYSVWDAKIAPTNSSILYTLRSVASASGGMQVFCSQDKGNTWTQVGALSVTWPDNETNDAGGTQYSHKLRIDPNNAACVVVGSPENGFFVTTNGLSGGSATWTQPTGTPSTSTAVAGGNVGVAGIVFDTASGTTGGLTNTVYAAVMGSGVWRTTTTVTGTWSLIASSPVNVCGAVVATGNYICCCSTATGTNPNQIQKFTTSWSTLVTVTAGVMGLALNPNDNTNLIYTEGGGGSHAGCIYQISTSGTNSLQYQTISVANGDAPALKLMPAGNYFSTGQCIFDPTTSQKMYMTCGIGVFYTTSITSPTTAIGTTITYVPQSSGIIAMVSNGLLKRGTGPLYWGGQDRQVWAISDPTVEPSSFGITSLDNNIYACWDLDVSPDGGTVIGAVGTGQGVTPDHSQVSTNSGATFTELSTLGTTPSWAGTGAAKFAAASSTNWIALTGNAAGGINFTTNGGATWTAGGGTLPGSGMPSARGNRSRPICADQVNIGTFYLRASGNGTYTSTNGGSTWSLVAVLPTTVANWIDTLQAAPGNAGHLWLCNGSGNGMGGTGHPVAGFSLYFSLNGGSTWTTVPNLEDPIAFGFGQAVPGFSYPTLWLIGWVKIGANPFKWGVWVSKDFNGSTMSWTWLTDYPAGSWDSIAKITGDAQDYTKCYIAGTSSSIIYGKNLSY
jgi:hypothetical protein